jgi:HK97 family phage prohead protease
MPTEQELREEIERAGKLERRVYDFGLHLEERADPVQDSNMTKGGPMISGHASVFNVPVDLGYFTETVKPGAFKRTIVEDDIRALFNHNPDYVLGRNTAGTLDLREDYKGLKVDIEPPDTQMARDLQVSIKRKDITQASIGFYARGYTLRKDDQGVWYRDLTDIMLYDVSPVTFPAFTATDMNVRSAQQIAATFRERPPEDLKPAEETWKRELEHRRRMLQLVRD